MTQTPEPDRSEPSFLKPYLQAMAVMPPACHECGSSLDLVHVLVVGPVGDRRWYPYCPAHRPGRSGGAS